MLIIDSRAKPIMVHFLGSNNYSNELFCISDSTHLPQLVRLDLSHVLRGVTLNIQEIFKLSYHILAFHDICNNPSSIREKIALLNNQTLFLKGQARYIFELFLNIWWKFGCKNSKFILLQKLSLIMKCLTTTHIGKLLSYQIVYKFWPAILLVGSGRWLSVSRCTT